MDGSTNALNPATTLYLQKLSLLACTEPSLTSFVNESLSAAQQLYTTGNTCPKCFASVVVGVSGSVRLVGGDIWLRCDGCSGVSRKRYNSELAATRSALVSARKRRRLVQSTTKPEPPAQSAQNGSRLPRTTVSEAAVPPQVSKAIRMARTKSITPIACSPATMSATSSKASTPTPLDGPLKKRAQHDNNVLVKGTENAQSLETLASASPTLSTASKLADSSSVKKRKRTNKPSGLAQMLEAKRKQDNGRSGGGVGLQDFLQGL
ncbi:hypothetical protein ACM66B_005592 [Microbotryomycetes sp. NB124-2]